MDQNICSYYADFIICELDLIQIYIDSKIDTIELVHNTRFFMFSNPDYSHSSSMYFFSQLTSTHTDGTNYV